MIFNRAQETTRVAGKTIIFVAFGTSTPPPRQCNKNTKYKMNSEVSGVKLNFNVYKAQKAPANVMTRREKNGQCAFCGIQTHRITRGLFGRTREPMSYSYQIEKKTYEVVLGSCQRCTVPNRVSHSVVASSQTAPIAFAEEWEEIGSVLGTDGWDHYAENIATWSDSKFIVSGRWVFNLESNEWETGPPPPYGATGSSITHGSRCFVFDKYEIIVTDPSNHPVIRDTKKYSDMPRVPDKHGEQLGPWTTPVLVDNQIYVVGGYANAFRLDPERLELFPVAELSNEQIAGGKRNFDWCGAGCYPAAGATDDGQIFIHGDKGFFRYDTRRGKLHVLASPSHKKLRICGLGIMTGPVFCVVGGSTDEQSNAGTQVSDAIFYNTKTNKWLENVPIPSIPPPHQYYRLACVGNYIVKMAKHKGTLHFHKLKFSKQTE